MPFPKLVLDLLQDSFDPIGSEDIRALESELGVAFPQDYVEFLLAYNCAYMRHFVAFDVRTPGPFVDGGMFDSSFGIVKEKPFDEGACNIRWNARAYRGRIPDSLIPIAQSTIDPICMSFSGSDYGRIYLWDSMEEGSDDNTYLVADSFTEFLKCLYPEDESILLEYLYTEDLPIFKAVEHGEFFKLDEYLADGGKVDCRNESCQTLLMCAARRHWPQTVRLLLARGADPNARDADDCTPMYHAAMGQSNDAVKLLLAAGGRADFCDDRGRTLLSLVEERSYYRIACTLEKHLSRR